MRNIIHNPGDDQLTDKEKAAHLPLKQQPREMMKIHFAAEHLGTKPREIIASNNKKFA